MPKICMKKNAIGCDDGIHAKEYIEGKEYELSDSLVKNFLVMGVCELVNEKPESEKKAVQDAPKNKAHKSAPKNKSELGE